LSSNGSFCPETDDSTWSDPYILIFHKQFSDAFVFMGGPNNPESYHHVDYHLPEDDNHHSHRRGNLKSYHHVVCHIITVGLRSLYVGTGSKAKP
jgi:hypothetical protein